jgi:hypothetical protein
MNAEFKNEVLAQWRTELSLNVLLGDLISRFYELFVLRVQQDEPDFESLLHPTASLSNWKTAFIEN